MPEYYLGLMSGTSVDGIDAVLVDLGGDFPALRFARTFEWPQDLRQSIIQIIAHPESVSLAALGELHATIGEQFGAVACAAIEASQLKAEQIVAIGSHGQTIYHAPAAPHPFSLQAGDANRIAEMTGVTTVADFRNRDIAAGGQGAPLVPAFHRAVFNDTRVYRAILNIGGIANLTVLPNNGQPVVGFDTGPGNGLLDAWHQQHRGSAYDQDGHWAAGGSVDARLLERFLEEPFFRQAPPRSTGRELFNLRWLETAIAGAAPSAAQDVQRTLLELTAATVAAALQLHAPGVQQLLVCGGGVHNRLLMQRLSEILAPVEVVSTERYGLHPDWVEATAFAWLAKQTVEGKPGNLPEVTGARRALVLGAIYPVVRGSGT